MGRDYFDTGVVIRDIASRSPAHRLQFRSGDVVVEVNGRAITKVGELRDAVAERQSRWDISVRRNGRRLSLSVTG